MPTPSTAEKKRTPLDSVLATAKLGRSSCDMLCKTSRLYPPCGSRGYFFQMKIQPESQANLVLEEAHHAEHYAGTNRHPVPPCNLCQPKANVSHKSKDGLDATQHSSMDTTGTKHCTASRCFYWFSHLPSRPCEQPGSPLSSCNWWKPLKTPTAHSGSSDHTPSGVAIQRPCFERTLPMAHGLTLPDLKFASRQ